MSHRPDHTKDSSIEVRHAFSYPVCDTEPSGESLTKQSFRDECDINRIVEAFRITGTTPAPLADYFYQAPDVTSFHDAMNYVIAAQADFSRIPARIRADFDNDPRRFVEFCLDPANMPKLVEYGLAVAVPAASAEREPKASGDDDANKPPKKSTKSD